MDTQQLAGVEVLAQVSERYGALLTPEVLRFVAELQRRFGPTREALLRARKIRQAAFDGGVLPDFLSETRQIREGEWRAAAGPAALQNRRGEITGPVARKRL